MVRILWVVVPALAVLLSSACDSDNEPTETPTIQASPTKQASDLPGDIDEALDAVASDDSDRLIQLLTLTKGPCVLNGTGLLPPPDCPGGASAGSLAPALVFGGCPDEPQYVDDTANSAVAGFNSPYFGSHPIGVVKLERPELPIAALFGFEKVAWLGFNEDGKLIGAGGGGSCATAQLKPRLDESEWLTGPDWSD
jgi:hypothetical protein